MFDSGLKTDNKNRIIFVNGQFNEMMAHTVINKLFEYECANTNADILLIIDSYGGQVDSFIAIHDAIRLCRCDVATLCLGKAMSCGQMLLMSGKKGKRFITTNSRVLVHEVSKNSGGKLSELDNDIEELKRMQKIISEMFYKYTKINKMKLTELLSKDSFLSADETVKLGIADYTITDAKSLYSKVKF